MVDVADSGVPVVGIVADSGVPVVGFIVYFNSFFSIIQSPVNLTSLSFNTIIKKLYFLIPHNSDDYFYLVNPFFHGILYIHIIRTLFP